MSKKFDDIPRDCPLEPLFPYLRDKSVSFDKALLFFSLVLSSAVARSPQQTKRLTDFQANVHRKSPPVIGNIPIDRIN